MTILDEHRIEQMRSVVMDAVDADVRRRARRTRVAVRTGVVLCVLAVVASLGAHFTSGHGRSSETTADFSSRATSRSAATGGVGSMADSAAAGAALPMPSSDVVGGYALSPTTGPAGRSVITTGSAHLVTRTPLKTADDFISWVQGNGGRVDGQTATGVGRKARVTLTVRVPDEESAITRLRALGSLEQVETHADDVTTRTTDLDARIKETKISIARLEAILSRTSSTRDVITAEGALTTRQQQLESMVEQRKTLSDQIALATLGVTFTAKVTAKAAAHSPGWFHRTFTRSLHKFGGGADAALEVIGYVIAWLVLAGLIVLLWSAVVRLARRRRS